MKFLITTFLSILASYFFVLNNGFLGDDAQWIVGNRELLSLKDTIFGGLGDRPILMFIIWIQFFFFKLNPLPYKIVSLLLHSIASLQAYKLILELSPSNKKNTNTIAFMGALIFAMHPLHSQTINIIIQVGVILAGLFAISSFRYFLKFERTGEVKHWFISFLLLSIGILSKPIVSFMPLFYCIWAFSIRGSNKKHLYYPLYFLTLAFPAIFYFLLKKNVQGNALPGFQYFLTQTEVIFTYFKLMIFPYGLKYLYDFTPPEKIWPTINWLYLVFHISILYTGKKIIKEKNHLLIFIGIYLSFIPESSFFAIHHLAFEHRTYLALFFMYVLITLTAIKFQDTYPKQIKLLGIVAITSFFLLNQIRNFQIKPYTNWMLHTLENEDTHHNYNFNFATYLIAAGFKDEVSPVVNRYIQRFPEVTLYKLLFDIHLYYKSNSKDKRPILKRLAENVQYPFDGTKERIETNFFVIQKLMKEEHDIEDYLLIENMLSQQMKIFFSNKQVYQSLTAKYYQVAKILLSKDFESEYAKKDHVHFLKTKTILYFYYDEKFNSLEDDIKKEFLKHPKSTILPRLLEMIRDKKSS